MVTIVLPANVRRNPSKLSLLIDELPSDVVWAVQYNVNMIYPGIVFMQDMGALLDAGIEPENIVVTLDHEAVNELTFVQYLRKTYKASRVVKKLGLQIAAKGLYGLGLRRFPIPLRISIMLRACSLDWLTPSYYWHYGDNDVRGMATDADIAFQNNKDFYPQVSGQMRGGGELLNDWQISRVRREAEDYADGIIVWANLDTTDSVAGILRMVNFPNHGDSQ